MKRYLPAFFALLFNFYFLSAQVSSDYAVLLTASVTENPASITIHWPTYPDAETYDIFRKPKALATWTLLSELTGTATEFSDNTVVIDSGYEYRVVRTSSSQISASGYIYSAIKLHAVEYCGKCLLIVDTTKTATMQPELFRLMKDISGDGWAVKRLDVSGNDSVHFIKNLILTEQSADPDVKAVLLFGHVPVPYSGNINPDGHPDHLGAWPADLFYGDINGQWTDNFVNSALASRPENWNIPGDGKYDQSVNPSAVDLQIGRVDLYNLPAFADSEAVLLKNYLDKDHAFRSGEFTAQSRGLIDDNFGAFGGEAFASVGWRNFSPMFGDTAIHELDYFPTMQSNSYLWSYGCGGGWYQGAAGVGSTADCAADTVQTVFTMLFGSYFGDWDNQDNFLRSPLASKNKALTCCWAGRPYWYFHHMALGENIGYSTLISQNNISTYASNYGAYWVHVALMGDPTLRMHVVKPPSDITLTPDSSSSVKIDWTASADSVIGYFIYRCSEEFGKYERISDTIIPENNFVDLYPVNGINYYMVRAVKLEETFSGSYYNQSGGISDSISVVVTANNDVHISSGSFLVYPNPADDKIVVQSSEAGNGDLLEITDETGRILSIPIIKGRKSLIDISKLSAGIYFLRMKNGIKKLVVM